MVDKVVYRVQEQGPKRMTGTVRGETQHRGRKAEVVSFGSKIGTKRGAHVRSTPFNARRSVCLRQPPMVLVLRSRWFLGSWFCRQAGRGSISLSLRPIRCGCRSSWVVLWLRGELMHSGQGIPPGCRLLKDTTTTSNTARTPRHFKSKRKRKANRASAPPSPHSQNPK